MQVRTTHEYHGREFVIWHSTHKRLRDCGALETYHFIEIFHGGHLVPVRVSGYDSENPIVTKLDRIGGGGWLRVCEILVDWDKLNPDNFLAWV